MISPIHSSGRDGPAGRPVTAPAEGRFSIAAAISSGNTSGVQANAGTPSAASAAAFSWS